MLAIVDELDRKIQVRLAQLLLNGLQIVAGLRGNSQFVALNLHLDTLGAVVADHLAEFLGLFLSDPGLESRRNLALLPR